jgi:hypothetical protein
MSGSRWVEDPLEREACNQAHDFMEGLCFRKEVPQTMIDLLEGRLTEEQAAEQLKKLFAERIAQKQPGVQMFNDTVSLIRLSP